MLSITTRCVVSILLFLLSVSAPALAGQPSEQEPGVLRTTLKNGLRVVIVQDPLAPVVTTAINYLAGANETDKDFPGTAHALEHMMFRGSPGLSASQLSSIIAAMGGDFDADTRQTVTQYFFTVPARYLSVALKIEAIRMTGIVADDKLWEQERGAIEQEVAQDLSNPGYIFYTKLLERMFEGSPYAHDALGTRPSFQKTTDKMLRDFHSAWYVPNNAVLIITGDVEPEKALVEVKKIFEDIPSGPIPQRPRVNLQPVKPSEIRMETDLPYGLAIVSYRLPGSDDPDFAASRILAGVLGSQRGDLYALVPEGKALDADFSMNVLPMAASSYATVSFPKGGDGAALISNIKEIISNYIRNGIPAELVEAAKLREISDAEFAKNSVKGLAIEWSEALAVEGRFSPEDDVEAIKKVTVEDVDRVAHKYLDNGTAIAALLIPTPSGKPVSSKGFGGAESFSAKYTKPVRLPEWARKVEEPPVIPGSNVNPLDTRLPNGMRVIVQPVKVSPTVSIYGQIRNKPSMQEPQGKDGVSIVLENLFSYGTTTLDRLALRKAFDDIGAEVSVGSGFFLKATSSHFERGVQLISDNLLHPALPGEAFKVVQEETEGMLAGELQSPDYLAKYSMHKQLYPAGDPSLRQATPETVGSLTLGDVKEYFRKNYRPDLTTIVVVGNVTPKEAREVIEKYFGEWKSEGRKPVIDEPRVPRNKPSLSVVPDTTRVQDEVVLAETVGITRSHPDYYKLQLGNNVLSGAFYATRLYHDLREQAGLVYTVESFLQARKTRAVFAVTYACDPQNVSRARALVQRNLRQMQAKPVSPVELRRAKTVLVRRLPLSESSVDAIAGGFVNRSVEELPLDEPVIAARQYIKITAKEIQAAYARWIRPKEFAQVIQGPNPR
jgi:zinc protease